MSKDQLPVARRHDLLEDLDLPLLNFFRWLGILGTLIFGVVTIWFFITAHRGLFVGFLVVTILSAVVWRVATRRQRKLKLTQ
jgi:membrane protein implicated in regulation of membrane protease activity